VPVIDDADDNDEQALAVAGADMPRVAGPGPGIKVTIPAATGAPNGRRDASAALIRGGLPFRHDSRRLYEGGRHRDHQAGHFVPILRYQSCQSSRRNWLKRPGIHGMRPSLEALANPVVLPKCFASGERVSFEPSCCTLQRETWPIRLNTR
jgi:hypothetical protein